MSLIPMTPDLAAAVGQYGEEIDNRSLLLDKFVVPKTDATAQEWKEAPSWSLQRIATNGRSLLTATANSFERQARGRNAQPQNVEAAKAKAAICRKLAQTKAESVDAINLSTQSSQQLVNLVCSSYPQERYRICAARLESRLAINLADGLIENAGISIDRLYGTPLIPGSAIKGVTRAAALDELKAAAPSQQADLLRLFSQIFGTAASDYHSDGSLASYKQLAEQEGVELERKGAIAFLPATTIDKPEIVVDITTVHYPDYYKSGNLQKLRNEKPLPNTFPAVEKDVRFAFVLVSLKKDLEENILSQAERWLHSALTVKGIGAKTAAGYGWFAIDHDWVQQQQDKALKEKQQADSERLAREQQQQEQERIQSLPPLERYTAELLALNDQDFAEKVKNIAALDEDEQRALLRLFTSNKEKRARLKNWRKKKPDNIKALETVAQQLGENLP